MKADFSFIEKKDTFGFMNEQIFKSPLVNEKTPCDKCDGDCCGPVLFEVNQILDIFNKYQKTNKSFKKRFPWNNTTFKRNMRFRQAFPDNVNIIYAEFKDKSTYRKRGINPDSCIFKDNEQTGGCMIYEDRPIVCREYGNRECLRCPYTGLDKQPEDLLERKRLVLNGHKYRTERLAIETMSFKI